MTLIKNKDNTGFAKANNQGISKSTGRYTLFLNSDTFLIENSLAKMIEFMDNNKQIGIASCQLLNSNRSIQETGGYFPTLPRVVLWALLIDDIPGVSDLFGSYHPHTPKGIIKSNFYKKERNFDWVKGAFMLVRRQVLEKIGGFDENIFMYGEDVELCYRVKKEGWKVVYVPITKIVHIGGASGVVQNTLISEYKGLLYYYKKHKGLVQTFIIWILLKISSLIRILLFILLGKKELAKIYAKAFTAN